MSMVTLVSGGLDSTLMSVLAREERLEQFPLFIDYGQRARKQEWLTCKKVLNKLKLPKPVRMNLSGFGKTIPSGLTSFKLRLNEDAYLPGRNLLFLLVAGSYAYTNNCSAIAIGLLNDEYHLFPDQTKAFLEKTEQLFTTTFNRKINIVTPLMMFTKRDVLAMAKNKNISGTYSCHSGKKQPCGKCISCLEFINAGITIGGSHGR
jgi:7-cyano-7-deazaguanine synthase